MKFNDGITNEAYDILRISSGLVLLIISTMKFLMMDYWIDSYVPPWFYQNFPEQGLSIVVATGLFGIILGLMILFDWHTFAAAMSATIMLFIVDVLLLSMVIADNPLNYPGVFTDVMRNIGIIALFFTTALFAFEKDDKTLTIRTEL